MRLRLVNKYCYATMFVITALPYIRINIGRRDGFVYWQRNTEVVWSCLPRWLLLVTPRRLLRHWFNWHTTPIVWRLATQQPLQHSAAAVYSHWPQQFTNKEPHCYIVWRYWLFVVTRLALFTREWSIRRGYYVTTVIGEWLAASRHYVTTSYGW